MALSSMTGFARASGAMDGLHWQWEVKSVNGKGLETRCRLASGFEHLEAPARESVLRRFKRGNLQVSLSCDRGSSSEVFSVNEVALEQLLAITEKLRARLGGEAPRIDGLLGLRGVVEVVSEPVDPEVATGRDRAHARESRYQRSRNSPPCEPRKVPGWAWSSAVNSTASRH